MPRVNIVRSSNVVRTPRVIQLEGMFEIPPTKKNEISWDVNLPIDEKDWSIGLIVGPSGCGKSTVAKELFGKELIESFEWSKDKTIVDDFPKRFSIKDIVGALSSVGFSSPPSWLRPFHVLSNGEQFRVTMARALLENEDIVAIDEFTSVVDRNVAQIGSYAISKMVRNSGKKFIAVACHYDIIDWLQPDWIYQPHTNTFEWRSVRRRPDIELKIIKCDKTAWKIFKKHHYLDTDINPSAQCFVGIVNGAPAVFTAVLSFPHPTKPGWREHRTVCLPDYQGVGLGNAMSEYIASIFSVSKPYRSTTAHPAMIYHRAKSKKWKMFKPPSIGGKQSGAMKDKWKPSSNRITASFEWVGQKDQEGFTEFYLKLKGI